MTDDIKPEPVTLADVLDALNLFNRPKPLEDDGPWEAGHFIRVDCLPAFINIIRAARFAAPAHAPTPLTDDIKPFAYFYHDAERAEDASPMLHSTLLVVAAERRPRCRNETPLYTRATLDAAVAADRARIRALVAELREAHAAIPAHVARSAIDAREQRAWAALRNALEDE